MICRVRQHGDQMQCSCGLAWDVNDPEPPVCPRPGPVTQYDVLVIPPDEAHPHVDANGPSQAYVVTKTIKRGEHAGGRKVGSPPELGAPYSPGPWEPMADPIKQILEELTSERD